MDGWIWMDGWIDRACRQETAVTLSKKRIVLLGRIRLLEYLLYSPIYPKTQGDSCRDKCVLSSAEANGKRTLSALHPQMHIFSQECRNV